MLTTDQLQLLSKNTLMEHLGIEYIELSEGRVVAKMSMNALFSP